MHLNFKQSVIYFLSVVNTTKKNLIRSARYKLMTKQKTVSVLLTVFRISRLQHRLQRYTLLCSNATVFGSGNWIRTSDQASDRDSTAAVTKNPKRDSF